MIPIKVEISRHEHILFSMKFMNLPWHKLEKLMIYTEDFPMKVQIEKGIF